jgi:hypothetical protein
VIEVEVRGPSGLHVALIDDEDEELLVHTWRLAGGKGGHGKYAATVIVEDGQAATIYLHRAVAARMGLIDGLKPEKGMRGRWLSSIDHANGNKLDCRRENLRVRIRADQMRNPNDRPRNTNRSGHRGVSFVARRERYGKPWMAYVTVNYRTKNLGWYATAEEAAAARRRWDEQHAKEEP